VSSCYIGQYCTSGLVLLGSYEPASGLDLVVDSPNYYRQFGRDGKASKNEMLEAIARLASIHTLGMLVIDEVQRISKAKSGGVGEMLNFFTEIVNTIGVPIILVGTYKALSVLMTPMGKSVQLSGQKSKEAVNCEERSKILKRSREHVDEILRNEANPRRNGPLGASAIFPKGTLFMNLTLGARPNLLR
jgi:hypothetical protein